MPKTPPGTNTYGEDIELAKDLDPVETFAAPDLPGFITQVLGTAAGGSNGPSKMYEAYANANSQPFCPPGTVSGLIVIFFPRHHADASFITRQLITLKPSYRLSGRLLHS